ncbi:MAG: hypothetical protein ACREBW_09045 [Candidatus Micrarchaeaceae archaeon]
MRPEGLYQPVEAVPPAPPNPNLSAIYHAYLDSSWCYPPWKYPWDPDSGAWEDDYSEWQAGWEQWDLDSANFFSGKDQQMFDTTGMDAGAAAIVNGYYKHDFLGLYSVYYTEEVDSAIHANGYDVDYMEPNGSRHGRKPGSSKLAEYL